MIVAKVARSFSRVVAVILSTDLTLREESPTMIRSFAIRTSNPLEALEGRLSLSAAVSGLAGLAYYSDHLPPPNPEPDPGPLPIDDPPIVLPPVPPSGPAGPGKS